MAHPRLLPSTTTNLTTLHEWFRPRAVDADSDNVAQVVGRKTSRVCVGTAPGSTAVIADDVVIITVAGVLCVAAPGQSSLKWTLKDDGTGVATLPETGSE
jgi:hypothetical protein